jgi:hypothetical protein
MKEHKQVTTPPGEKDPAGLQDNDLRLRNGESKQERVDSPDSNLVRLASTKPGKANSTMHTDMPTRSHHRKAKGRLSRETMVKLGKVLGDYFDHVREQEMPDRIAEVLSQFEKVNDKGTS